MDRGALMPNQRTFARSFAGGEVTPEFFGRVDDIKYQTGLQTCRNYIVKPHGVLANRGGLRLVRQGKNPTVKKRLIPFVFSNDQSFAIELGAGYFRFHTNGGTVLSGGNPYEVTNPYSSDELAAIKYVQSNDVLTFVHPNHPPAELRRLAADNWLYVVIPFGSALAKPTSVSATASPATTSPGTPYLCSYVVTAVVGSDEGPASSAEVS
jgi:hypothetical protein